MSNYFANLPEEQRVQLAAGAQRYGIGPIHDLESALELLARQRLEIETLDAHAAWLKRAKAAVERTGREWNRANFQRYCALREHE